MNDDAPVSQLSPAAARELFRAGRAVPTSGWSDGFAQANLIAVPQDWAYDVLLFAHRNPKSCPLLGVLEAGQLSSDLLPGGDIRTDIPRYTVHRDGQLVDSPTDVTELWRDDLVAFLIGCSFTFEAALLEAGLPLAHQDQGVNVPMYRTSIPAGAAGRLHGPTVVSRRPLPGSMVADAVRITSRYPAVHGAPLHVGDPAAIGIEDLSRPDYGDAVEIPDGWLPVFWACGVTPQAAIAASGVPFAMGHAPGNMLITDAPNASYQVP